jgi:hypothetical protein
MLGVPQKDLFARERTPDAHPVLKQTGCTAEIIENCFETEDSGATRAARGIPGPLSLPDLGRHDQK